VMSREFPHEFEGPVAASNHGDQWRLGVEVFCATTNIGHRKRDRDCIFFIYFLRENFGIINLSFNT
jgi:hypothetical protein